MKARIRKMVGADLAAVEAIYRRNVADGLPPQSLGTIARAIDDHVEAPLAWIALGADREAVGYIVGEVRSWEFGSPPAGWVVGVGVNPELQGTGVGDRLLQALLGAFAERGVHTIRTMVQRDDIRVLRFFRGSGFRTGPYTELELDIEGHDP